MGAEAEASLMKFLIILAALAAANAWDDVAALSCKNGKADLADGQEVTIETPNYPENYPNKAKCNWKIKVPANEEVHIWCETFDLLKGDFLRVVGATSKLYGSFPNGFGEILPASSAERTLKFQFQSNKKKNAGGFRCQIVALAPNSGSGSGLTTAGSGSSVPGTCQCGIKGGAANSRIVGGQETEENEYPWQVALVSTGWWHYPWCGGTLISSTHVLTAAHCVYEKEASDIQVLLREHNTADSVIKTADVAEIINHPDWDRPTIDNDYAILRLAKPVKFNKKVAPACLPADTAATYAGVLGTVTGWGKLKHTDTHKSTTLQEVDLTVTTQSDCIKAYGNWNITANMICAAATGKSTCTGDSGGPLIAQENGRYAVIGIVSFGCQRYPDVYPSVLARVTEKMSWILENTAGTLSST